MIYRLYVPMQGTFQMDEPAYEIEGDMDLLEPPMEEYIPGFIPLSEGELAEYEEEVQRFLHRFRGGSNPLDSCGLFKEFVGYDSLRGKLERVDVTAVTKDCCLQGVITVETSEQLTDQDRYILTSHIKLQFRTGWGNHFPQIEVPGGRLKIVMKEPDSCYLQVQKKYEVTDIPHPKYPWLHRIRSLVTVNDHVPAGELGGYVEWERNLSQEGECWIHDSAICCENAVVEKNARLFDGAMAREEALVTGDACMFERAVAEGLCTIRSGEIKEDARIAGYAVVSEDRADGLSPVIGGNSNVYGEVRGWFVVKDNILPKEEFSNPTRDLFILENGKREVMVTERKLEPPQKFVQQQSAEKPKVPQKKKKGQER